MKSALMLATNPNAEREENDFYATHPNTVKTALEMFKEIGLHEKVWECACGMGHISEVLKQEGYTVHSSDLINRGYGETKDFLKSEKMKEECDIVTNPPFKLAEKFIEHAMEILHEGRKAVFLLKIQFAEGGRRKKEIYDKYRPKYVYINSKRQLCSKNAEFEKYKCTTQCYCWFVFEKGYTGETVMRWI